MAERNIIPADLYEEILHLLPSNALLNFKRVCKDWNQLISSPRFIQKHLHRSNGTLIFEISGLRIILCDDIPTGKKIYRNISYLPKLCDNDFRIAGSCDGLVCLVMMNSRHFAIINPSTGKSDVRTLTDGFFFRRRLVYWFGKHPSTGEYLIVALKGTSSGITQVYLLSSKQRSSEYFEINPPTANYNPPTAFCPPLKPIGLLHGALHWLVIHQNVRLLIFAYDIEKKEVVEIFHPFEPPFRLGTVEGCLSAIIRTQEGNFEMWMMREYGVEESWSKYCSIEGFDERHRVLSPLGFVGDGVLLLNVGNNKIVKYRFSDKRGRVVYRVSEDDFREREIAVLCGDSLVSPSIDWGST